MTNFAGELLEAVKRLITDGPGYACTALPEGWSISEGPLIACAPGGELCMQFRSESGSGALLVRMVDGRLQIGRELSFGYPLPGNPPGDGTVSWFFPPPSFCSKDAALLASGEMPFSAFHDLVNASAKADMGVPRERFPRSCLVMLLGQPLPLRNGIPQVPERFFALWVQDKHSVEFHDLPVTNNPHEAASYATELGYAPTIYRSTCGSMVAFKETPGSVFLPH